MKIYIVYVMIFAIIMGIVVHEGIHIIQERGKIKEVCFLGYQKDEKAGGWVVPNEMDPNYFAPKDGLDIKEIPRYMFQRDELLPTIAGFITTMGIAGGLMFHLLKIKLEQDEENFLARINARY